MVIMMSEKEALFISDRYNSAWERLVAARFLFVTWDATKGGATEREYSLLEDAVEEYQQALFAYASICLESQPKQDTQDGLG
jgi:DNA-binding PadR family transcriptional regulator